MMLFYFQRLVEIFPVFPQRAVDDRGGVGNQPGRWQRFSVCCWALRASENKLLVGIIGAYVAVIRGTPFVVQIFIVFFILPEWGIQLDAFPAAILALTILGTAFICEIVAGGIKAVPRGQWEAASSSGLNIYQQLRYVIVPQSLQTILPPLVGQYVLLIKDSSVVSVIGVDGSDPRGMGDRESDSGRVDGLLAGGIPLFRHLLPADPVVQPARKENGDAAGHALATAITGIGKNK
jgi:polar amino acid transport system permease protein